MYDSAIVPYSSGYANVAMQGIANSTSKVMIMVMGLTYIFIVMVIAVLQIVAMWKVFTKAGEKGWKAIIPIYNTVILFKIAGLSPWLVLVYLAMFIPVIGSLVALGLTIYLAYNLAKSFGKGGGFTVGLVLLAPIFYMILGFGSAEYVGNTVKTTEE